MRRCGAIAQSDGSVRWRVWAPNAKRVELVLLDADKKRELPMEREEGGYFTHVEQSVSEEQRYAYRLDGGEERQDPCSLWQPHGVPGPSAVVRTYRFQWTDQKWKGISRKDLVFYELHVGTFTSEGTFDAIIERLPSLRELGITAIELMPIAQFPGTRNWGYDGVLPYAAQNSYGGPYELQRFVDAAHAVGLAVFLDVVYNHLGPEGSFLHEFGDYFTKKYNTPWGQAVNYDDRHSDAVRDWVLDNARMWLEEFHLDGLRLDAVHAIFDLGPSHILRAIKNAADEVSHSSGRKTHVIAESDLNDPRLLHSHEQGGHNLDAQWNDDFHHCVHALLTGERTGYYKDYGRLNQLPAVLNSPFVFAGDYSHHRGRKHGAPPIGLSGDRFVVSIQNHDQVGNRAKGDRLGAILRCPARQRMAACLMLFSPYLPLFFMGEEYGETNPFPYFCSFQDEKLKQSVREGRRSEFAEFVNDSSEVPDPCALGTFNSAKLSWSWPEESMRTELRRLYRDLLKARREWPALRDTVDRASRLVDETEGAGILELARGGADTPEHALRIYFNLWDCRRRLVIERQPNHALLFSSSARVYGGGSSAFETSSELQPFECIAIGPRDWLRFS